MRVQKSEAVVIVRLRLKHPEFHHNRSLLVEFKYFRSAVLMWAGLLTGCL
jgi:hypothetical protein